MKNKPLIRSLCAALALLLPLGAPARSAADRSEVEVKPVSFPPDAPEIPWFGGNGGSYSRLSCPWIYGMGGASGTYLDSLRFRCMSGKGALMESATVGGTGGAIFSDRCEPGFYATGIWGRAGTYVDFFGLICRDIDTATEVMDLAARGGTGGSPFRYECPPRKHLGGVEVHSGTYIDAVRPICVDD